MIIDHTHSADPAEETGYDRKDRDMTRKETIEIMRSYKEVLEQRVDNQYNPGLIDVYSIQIEAFEMAIDALQGDMYCPNCGVRLVTEDEYLEPTSTHGRLIDADALSEKLCETTIFIKDGEVFQRMINDAPTVSAEATCETCADRALCIMSAPDGNWKACKDYRPQVETVHKPDYSYEADMVKRLRQAEAKGDLISRQDAVNTIKRYKHRLQGRGQTYGFLLEEFEHQIPSASAEAVQGWIPCSERLPETEEEVLVSFYWVGGASGTVYKEMALSRHSHRGWEDMKDGIDTVEAWMPLPKPYKGGNEE